MTNPLDKFRNREIFQRIEMLGEEPAMTDLEPLIKQLQLMPNERLMMSRQLNETLEEFKVETAALQRIIDHLASSGDCPH